MPTGNRRWFILVVVVAVAAVVGLSSMVYAFARSSTPPSLPQEGDSNWPAQMGSMMRGWGYLNGNQLNSVTPSQPASAANGTLTYGGDSIRILVLMGPMSKGLSMYSFVIDNFTNPTLVLPRGAEVTMLVVNVDTDGYHGLTLTTVPPTYPYNLMPTMMDSFASSSVLPPSSSSGFASQQISFTVDGGMYYVCPVPGHAQSGMYGQIMAV